MTSAAPTKPPQCLFAWQEENSDQNRYLDQQKNGKPFVAYLGQIRTLLDQLRHVTSRANKGEYLVPLLGHALCGKGL